MRRRSYAFNKQWIGRSANEKSLRRYCFEIWSDLVRERDGHVCFMCGDTKNLTAHHLITKKWLPTALQVKCGITLCRNCHSCKTTCVHLSPWFFEKKLKELRKEQFEWYENCKFTITDNVETINYKNELIRLLKEFEIVKPIKMLRSHYFRYTDNEEKQIVEEYNNCKNKRLLTKKWNCSKSLINSILNRHGVTKETLKNDNKYLKQKQYGHCVCEIDDNNNILAEYPSIKEAARCNGVVANSIKNCIDEKSFTCCGKKWVLKKDLGKSFRQKKKRGPKNYTIYYKAIVKTSPDGIEYNYPSIASAVASGYNTSSIHNALKNKKMYRGFLWRYK